MTMGQRGLVWAVIMIVSLTMLILGIVLTIRAVQSTVDDEEEGGNQPGKQPALRETINWVNNQHWGEQSTG